MTTLARALTLAGLACLAVITLASPGATRMWATPWTLALLASLLLPAAALVVRSFDPRAPLILPARAWLGCALAIATVVMLSALTSPFAGLSLRWSAPLLAGPTLFLVAFDWLHASPDTTPDRRARLARTGLIAAVVLGGVSLGLWFPTVLRHGLREAVASRNAFPLGHSNYTAGLALLILPIAASGFWRQRGIWRTLAAIATLLALAMLFSSSSRGGVVGLAALAAAALALAPIPSKAKGFLAVVVLAAGLGFVVANPRIRATFTGGTDRQLVAGSESQRLAMAQVSRHLGAARPLLGWGPGTTPLVYPKYRAIAAGGVENVLQLHSTPLHVWAELGLAGLACLAAGLVLAFRGRRRAPLAAVTFAGYAAFALTDWQLDVPIFALALALLAALLAPICHLLDDKSRRWLRGTIGVAALLGVGIVVLFGRRDPAPELNVRALALAREPAGADPAIALLRESLALNPDQEIAHFNLGWLLVVRAPATAERHFRAAAQLVPDKGGVYFGLGLARLNQGNTPAAAHAFALECLNDPRFLSSPWWREPAIAATRDAAAAAFASMLTSIGPLAPAHPLDSAQLGRVPPGPGGTYRRTRSGYPVLMRNLDLDAPIDLFDVREATLPPGQLRALPPKGWLPSPVLLRLLDAPASPKP